jgi:NADH-quinone oxidoreductase subunit C
MSHEATLTRLRDHLGADALRTEEFKGNVRAVVPRGKLYSALEFLKQQGGFDLLIDVTAVDYLHYPKAQDRFGVIHALLNSNTGERLYVKVYLNEPELSVPSAFPLWKGADWLEREVYDMFGILFEGHPNMRRILMPEEFTAFPLRKDYPMKGRGERHNFPVITRAES